MASFEDDDFGDFESFQEAPPPVVQTVAPEPAVIHPQLVAEVPTSSVTIEDVAESDEEFEELQSAAGVSESSLKHSAKYQCTEDDPVLSEVPSESIKLTTSNNSNKEDPFISTTPLSPSKSFGGGLDDLPLPDPVSLELETANNSSKVEGGVQDDEFDDFGQFEGSPVPTTSHSISESTKDRQLDVKEHIDSTDAFAGLDGPVSVQASLAAVIHNENLAVEDDPYAAFDDIIAGEPLATASSNVSVEVPSVGDAEEFGQFEATPAATSEATSTKELIGGLDDNVLPTISSNIAAQPPTVVDDDPFAAFDDLVLSMNNPAESSPLAIDKPSSPSQSFTGGLDSTTMVQNISSQNIEPIVKNTEIEDENFGQFEGTPAILSEAPSSKQPENLLDGLEDNSTPEIPPTVISDAVVVDDNTFGAFDEIGTSTKDIAAASTEGLVGGLDSAAPVSNNAGGVREITKSLEIEEFGQFEEPIVQPLVESTDLVGGLEDNSIPVDVAPPAIATTELTSVEDAFAAFDEIGSSTKVTSEEPSSPSKEFVGGFDSNVVVSADLHIVTPTKYTNQLERDDFEDFGQFEASPMPDKSSSMSQSEKSSFVELGSTIENADASATPIVEKVPDVDAFSAFGGIVGSQSAKVDITAPASSSEDFVGGLEANNVIETPASISQELVAQVEEESDEFGQFETTSGVPSEAQSSKERGDLLGGFDGNSSVSAPSISIPDIVSVSNIDPFGAFDEIGASTKVDVPPLSPSTEFVGALGEQEAVSNIDLHIVTPTKGDIIDDGDEFGDFGQFEASPIRVASTSMKSSENISLEGDLITDAIDVSQPPTVVDPVKTDSDGDEFGEFGEFEASPVPVDSTSMKATENISLESDFAMEIDVLQPLTVIDPMKTENDSDEFGDFGEFEASPVPTTAVDDNTKNRGAIVSEESSSSSSSWQVVDTPTTSQNNANIEENTPADEYFGDFTSQSTPVDISPVAQAETIPTQATVDEFGEGDDDFGDFSDFSAPATTPAATIVEKMAEPTSTEQVTASIDDPFGGTAVDDEFDAFVDGNVSAVPTSTTPMTVAKVEDAFGTNDDDFDDFAEFSSAPVEDKKIERSKAADDDFFASSNNNADGDDWDAFAEAPSTAPVTNGTSTATIAPPSAPASFAAFEDTKSNDDEWDAFESTPAVAAAPASFDAFSQSSVPAVEFSVNTGNAVIDEEVLSLKALTGAGNASNEFFTMFAEMSLLSSSLFPTSASNDLPTSNAVPATGEVLQFDADWLENIFDGNVPSTLESAPLTRWITDTIERILTQYIPSNACSIDELKDKIESDSLKMNYLAAKNRQMKCRRIASSEMILNRSDSNQEVKVEPSNNWSETTTKSTPSSSNNSSDWDAFAPRIDEPSVNSTNSSSSGKDNSNKKPSVTHGTETIGIAYQQSSPVPKHPPSTSANTDSELSKAASDFLKSLPDLSYILK